MGLLGGGFTIVKPTSNSHPTDGGREGDRDGRRERVGTRSARVRPRDIGLQFHFRVVSNSYVFLPLRAAFTSLVALERRLFLPSHKLHHKLMTRIILARNTKSQIRDEIVCS